MIKLNTKVVEEDKDIQNVFVEYEDDENPTKGEFITSITKLIEVGTQYYNLNYDNIINILNDYFKVDKESEED